MEREFSQKDALSIIICQEPGVDNNIVAQVEQGIEEEQVPAHVINSSGSSMDLARFAADCSSLGVGVGIDRKGVVTISHFRMPPNIPVFQISALEVPNAGKTIGVNAARLFKGNPFIIPEGVKNAGNNLYRKEV